MPWIRLRTIVCELDASEEIAAACAENERFQEYWDGMEWLLARDPKPQGSFSTVVNGIEYQVYGSTGEKSAKLPDLWLVYTCTEEQVVVYGINPIEPEED